MVRNLIMIHNIHGFFCPTTLNLLSYLVFDFHKFWSDLLELWLNDVWLWVLQYHDLLPCMIENGELLLFCTRSICTCTHMYAARLWKKNQDTQWLKRNKKFTNFCVLRRVVLRCIGIIFFRQDYVNRLPKAAFWAILVKLIFQTVPKIVT